MVTRLVQLKWWRERHDYAGWHYWSRGSRWYSAYIGSIRYRVTSDRRSGSFWRVSIDYEEQAEAFDSAREARLWCDAHEDRRLDGLRYQRDLRWHKGWRRVLAKAGKTGCFVLVIVLPLALAVLYLVSELLAGMWQSLWNG